MSDFKNVNEIHSEVAILQAHIEKLELELESYRSKKKPEDEIISVEIRRLRDRVINGEELMTPDVKKFEVLVKALVALRAGTSGKKKNDKMSKKTTSELLKLVVDG